MTQNYVMDNKSAAEEIMEYMQDRTLVIDDLLQGLAQVPVLPKSWAEADEAQKEQIQQIVNDVIIQPVFSLLSYAMEEMDDARLQEEFQVAGRIFSALISMESSRDWGDTTTKTIMATTIKFTRQLRKELRKP